jgi:hypothetical protein
MEVDLLFCSHASSSSSQSPQVSIVAKFIAILLLLSRFLFCLLCTTFLSSFLPAKVAN